MGSFEQWIKLQFDELKQEQPLLNLEFKNNSAIIFGLYCIRCLYEEEEFLDQFEIEAIIYPDFPRSIPIVKEIGGKVRCIGFEHIYPDRVLCLEIDTRMLISLDKNPSVLFFFEEYVSSYFFSYLYYRKRRSFPFGERSHGDKGTLEFYCELFDVSDLNVAMGLLHFLTRDTPVKGHHHCPCNSGKRYRDCHRNKINELRSSKHFELFKSDYRSIMR